MTALAALAAYALLVIASSTSVALAAGRPPRRAPRRGRRD